MPNNTTEPQRRVRSFGKPWCVIFDIVSPSPPELAYPLQRLSDRRAIPRFFWTYLSELQVAECARPAKQFLASRVSSTSLLPAEEWFVLTKYGNAVVAMRWPSSVECPRLRFAPSHPTINRRPMARPGMPRIGS